jgi:hypothetical protein
MADSEERMDEPRVPNPRGNTARWRIAALLVGLFGLALWQQQCATRPAPRDLAAPSEPNALRSDEPLEYAADGLPIKPRDARASVPEGPMHPHPMTAAHERIYRENNLVGALNLAVDLQDALRIRELVAQYRAEYPEDDHRLQDGYEIIADCLDRSDEATHARARRFWETEIRSQTRRYVRRYCLER